MSNVERVIQAALCPEVRSATVYDSPTERVTATRRHKKTARARTIELLVTFGKPNYEQRRFVKQCQKAGVRFPIAKPHLKLWKRKR